MSREIDEVFDSIDKMLDEIMTDDQKALAASMTEEDMDNALRDLLGDNYETANSMSNEEMDTILDNLMN